MGDTLKILCEVNGESRELEGYPFARLLDVLREQPGLTGTKEGCGEGECGACSVLLDGEVVNSCLVPLCQVDGRKLTTVEGLASGDKLHPVQEAFWTAGGAQCGICTPGMVLASVALLQENSRPSLAQVREGLSGNLCRCTGYMKIFDSVNEAAKKMESDR